MSTANSGITLPTGFYSPIPKDRVAALRRATPALREQLMSGLPSWPRKSPGSLNAWCVFLGPSPGVSGKNWNYCYLPSVGGAHPGIAEFKDSQGFWEKGIRPYARAIFRELTPDDAYTATMVRNLVPCESATAPKDRERMTEGTHQALAALGKLIRPRLVIALGGARKHTDRALQRLADSVPFDDGVLYTSNARDERRWSSIKANWESGEAFLYVSASGIHPSLYHISTEDTLDFLRHQSKAARSI